MAEDIYPLGQDKGLMADIINFGLNNLYQYGQKAGETQRQTSQVFSDIGVGKRPDLGPLTGDILSTSPLYTGVINWAGMTEPAKAMLQKFGQRYPKMIGAAEDMPAVLEASINSELPRDVAGALSKPLPSAHFMEVSPNYQMNPYTVGHELQHSLNAPRVAATDPLDALTIGTLLKDYLPYDRRGSLTTVLNKQIAKPSLWETLSGREPKNLQVINPDRNLMRSAMDEGLAYLGENAMRPGAPDQLKLLADRLGVNWENPRAVTGLGDVGSKLSSMAKRTEPASMYEKLPRAGRSFLTAEDIARQQLGETLPALGSAMPDIPRPVSSPGGLEFFENLRQKLGLPAADLGGAAPEFYGKPIPPPSIPGDPTLYTKKGSEALDEVFQDWLAANQRMGQGGGEVIPHDRFMDTVLQSLAIATHRSPAYEGLPQGISGFRRAVTSGDNMFSGHLTPNRYRIGAPHDPQKSLDILEHLREYGLLEPGVLEGALKSTNRGERGVLGQGMKVDPAGLERIKKLLERTGR